MIANSGVIAPLPYSHGSSGSGLTHFSPNNEVFLGRFLPFLPIVLLDFADIADVDVCGCHGGFGASDVQLPHCGSIASQPVVTEEKSGDGRRMTGTI